MPYVHLALWPAHLLLHKGYASVCSRTDQRHAWNINQCCCIISDCESLAKGPVKNYIFKHFVFFLWFHYFTIALWSSNINGTLCQVHASGTSQDSFNWRLWQGYWGLCIYRLPQPALMWTSSVSWMCLRTHPFRQLPLREGFNIPDMKAEFTWQALIHCVYLILLNNFFLLAVVDCGDWVLFDSRQLWKATVKLAFSHFHVHCYV